MMDKTCGKCGAVIPEGAIFCPACTAPVPGAQLFSHGAKLPEDTKFSPSSAGSSEEPRKIPPEAAVAETPSPQTGGSVEMGKTSAVMICAKCGGTIPAGSKYCPACAAPVPGKQTCVHCGATLPAGAKFCPACAKSAARPAEIPQDAQEAKLIHKKYTKKARIAYLILAVFCLLFLLMTFTSRMESEAQSRALTFLLLFFALYDFIVICFYYGFRRKAMRHAGIDPKNFKELLRLQKKLSAGKKRWEKMAAKRKRLDALQANSATGSAPGKNSIRSGVTFAVICLACIAVVLVLSNVLSGGSLAIFGGRTLNGVWVDTIGTTYSKGLATNPAIILFKPDGNAYFYQQGYASSQADIIEYGDHANYKISGNTISFTGSQGNITGEINGNTITIGGTELVPGDY
jgi:RNA polymerase subunit RPABC4/transcription elongation factor Spt4